VGPGLSTIVPTDLTFAPTPVNLNTFAVLAFLVLIAAFALGFINASRLIAFAWRARRAAMRAGAAVVEPLTGASRRNRGRLGRSLRGAGRSGGPPPLGHVLLMGRVIDRHQLRTALERQQEQRRPLGEILVSLGMASEEQIWGALSAQWGTSLGDLKNHWIDPALAHALPRADSVRYQMLPLRAVGDIVVLAMADPYDNHARLLAERRLGAKVVPVLARPSAIRAAQGEVYAESVLDESIAALRRAHPEASAHVLLTEDQKVAGAAIGMASLLLAIIFGGVFFIWIAAAIIALYAIVVSFRTWVIVRGAKFQDVIQVSKDELDALTDLPIYTILCPLYREAGVLPQLVKACADLDYPKSLLDVKLLLEADDLETLDVVRSFDLPSYFDVVVVPAEGPRTKPKACNYGLQFARGEYVVIFDAEDIPEPDQLKKAIATFRRSAPNVGCVQAKLSFYNPHQNILTAWFTLEYTSWFDFFLPGLVDLGLPVPLGGSSNHFPTALLRELQAWDPNNVTEDADLGMRLHRAGYRTVIVDSTTFEEANSDFVNWVKQRSRWGKGYAISWIVQMRHPRRLYKELGLKSFVAVQLTLGGTFGVALLNLAVWMLTLLWILGQFGFIQYLFPTAIYYVGMIELLVGNFFFLYIGLWSAQHRGAWALSRASLLVPIYWLIMSLAMFKALIQLFTKPGYWEKTVHGLFETQPLHQTLEPALQGAGVAYAVAVPSARAESPTATGGDTQ
jgi:cellulose synthase/poly-beta-1,6-N-acetylglucosamine synthase-like glycosyltransferase